MPTLLLKPLARADLSNIWLYIADDDPDKADQLLEMIEEKLRTLAATPMMGRVRDELAPALRSFPVKRYIIFYRPIPNGIEVIRVLHGAQDLTEQSFLE